jgi:N-acetylglucosamine kinase-like BadF-type ATPase
MSDDVSYLGLDIGGTKCRYEWWPEGAAPSGVDTPLHPAVDDGLAEKLAAKLSSVAKQDPLAAVVCMAGVDMELGQAIQKQLPQFGIAYPVAVVGDVLAAAAAGLRQGPGLVIWSGTGSFAVARNAAGDLFRVGGRGFQFGDEGSAFDLVRMAVVAALRSLDGRGRETVLLEMLTAAFKAPSPERLGAVAQQLRPREVASRLSVVIDAYEQDDWVAADVLEGGMHQLTQLGLAAAKLAGLKQQPGMAVALGGGVLEHHELVRDGLTRMLQASAGGELKVQSLPPQAAAAAAAWLASGWHQGEAMPAQWVGRVAL